MIRSMKTASGVKVFITSSAARPSSAVTTRYPFFSRNRVINPRKTRSLSTTRMFCMAAPLTFHPRRLTRACGKTMRESGLSKQKTRFRTKRVAIKSMATPLSYLSLSDVDRKLCAPTFRLVCPSAACIYLISRSAGFCKTLIFFYRRIVQAGRNPIEVALLQALSKPQGDIL